MKNFTRFAAAILLASGTMMANAPALAQDQAIDLKGDVKLEKVMIDDGGQSLVELVEPDTIVPGDKLIFGTEYSNNGTETVTNFVVTNPVPSAVRLAPAAPADLIVSVDGGATWGELATLSVEQADGTSRPAQQADVTHIRWTLATVAPGVKGRLEYPAIIR